MHTSSFAFILAFLMIQVAGVPYFRPWLETRQGGSPTPGPYPDLLYPPDHDASVCPATDANPWSNGQLAAAPIRRRRSLHRKFKVPHQGKGLRRRQFVNGTCSQIAMFSFSDWEGGANCNTQSVNVPGGHTYTFSMTANVVIMKITAWQVAVNSNKYSKLNMTEPKNKTAIVTMSPKDNVAMHFEIYFQFGHPNGMVALFSDQPPPPPAIPVAIAKRNSGGKKKKKKVYRAK